MPVDEINYTCAGINHMAFYLRSSANGEDLYPRSARSWTKAAQPATNRVRYEMFKRLGYFVTESSEHFAEYVPWFIKRDRPDLIERVQHSARRIPPPLREADRQVGIDA